MDIFQGELYTERFLYLKSVDSNTPGLINGMEDIFVILITLWHTRLSPVEKVHVFTLSLLLDSCSLSTSIFSLQYQ